MLTTKTNHHVAIRPAIEADAEQIIIFCKELFAATNQVITTLEEFNITAQEETEFIRSHENNPTAILLVAVCEEQVVGLLNFNCSSKLKLKHTGEFGFSVLPSFQKNGIGKALLSELLDWARTKEHIEKIWLEVMHTNEHAIRLYEDLGFKTESRKIRAVKQPDGSYADLIGMGYFFER